MIRLRSILTLLLLLVFQQSISAVIDYNVFFKNKTFVPIENHGVVDDLTIQKNTFQGNIFALVQFYEIPSNEQIALLQSQQITLGYYFKRNSYTVTFPSEKYFVLKNNPKVRSLFFQDASLKINQELLSISNTQENRKNIYLALNKGVDHKLAINRLKSEVPEIIFTGLQFGVYEINIAQYQITKIAELPFVH